ncbi:MAG TPA: M17 family peptidase N-terminal domain-containing protein, partial [Ramlibacter sp.]|uniref:M17 family peptidase N-terminal domain-containing protein n=1 Tax=Ramlibacter sp. TaxID=1917967 RepID=UPI002D7ECF18
MDFELKTLDLAGAAAEKCDVLVVLVPENFQAGKDAVSALVSAALAAKDLEPKPGKVLQAYRAQGIAAPRVILAGAGDGSGKRLQAAVQAAAGSVKSSPAKRMVILVPPGSGAEGVRAAVCGTA